MTLNGKAGLTGCGLQSCFRYFLTGQSNIASFFSSFFLFLIEQTIFAFVSRAFLFVSLFLYIIVEQWRRKGGLHQV